VHHKDRSKLIAVVKQGRRQFEEQLASERAEHRARQSAGEDRLPGWDSRQDGTKP
jgi:glutathione-regulated potassium-efflux system ancillary protein KefC